MPQHREKGPAHRTAVRTEGTVEEVRLIRIIDEEITVVGLQRVRRRIEAVPAVTVYLRWKPDA